MPRVNSLTLFIVVIIIAMLAVFIYVCNYLWQRIKERKYRKLISDISNELGINFGNYMGADTTIYVKSSKAVDYYTALKYFQEDNSRLSSASEKIKAKSKDKELMRMFLLSNDYINHSEYDKAKEYLQTIMTRLDSYYVCVFYSSPAGYSSKEKTLAIAKSYINSLMLNPTSLMNKSQYNQYIKAQGKELLEKKCHEYYEKVNTVIDMANDCKDSLVISADGKELDRLVSMLFDRTVNSIKKIKTVDSDEWRLIDEYITGIRGDVAKIVTNNQKILDYYSSEEFQQIKDSCSAMMASQKEFNEYITEKANSITSLFGIRTIRNETEINDEYNYIRPYKKSITPFTAEVSAAVFASAENNPLDYVVKYFYPNKDNYPEQIQKLQMLIEELETLKEAKQIIDDYKKEYQQYLKDVPDYILENDEHGFYKRLGFADINENELTVEYKFSYTSNGGFAQRTFTIPMTEDNIIELINRLQNKLTMSAFSKEQRSLMTSKLRKQIKERDNYTCKYCGNSTFNEPNLLLEIDHIIPVTKGGHTVPDNLQTLCWKCNRKKSNKILEHIA